MFRVAAFFLGCILLGGLVSPIRAQENRSQQEEERDHFRKWLREDVVYIITEEEREVFQSLQTEAEKQLFIEQFWARRDPDPGTSINEGREEHYRRIQYANDYFGSGGPGWRSDRGRIYIIFGPPDRLDSWPAGRVYTRPLSRGGGRTTSLPYETWWYDQIPGIGSGIELEFVDASMAGKYELALSPDEKDAMAHVPGAGETLYESLELTLRRLRSGRYGDPFAVASADQPFIRLHRYDQVQRPPDFRTLSERVTTRIQFSELATDATVHYLRRSPEVLTVPVTVTVSQNDLEYEELADAWVSRVTVYGKVETVAGQVQQEFEERFQVHLNAEEYQQREGNQAFYQKLLNLPPGRFKLSLIVQDETSGKLATSVESVILPDPVTTGLDASPLIVAAAVSPDETITPEAERSFRLSGYRVYPSTSLNFAQGRPVGIYLEAYPAAQPESDRTPVVAEIRVRRPGSDSVVKQFDITGSLQSVLGRWLFAGLLPTTDLEAGKYLLEAEFRTGSGERIVRHGRFSLAP